jgi:succinyl-diaminopimelate desuccinylase
LANPEDVLKMRAMPERSAERTARSGAVLSWLREREEKMAALVTELVAIPTENPPGKNYRACADFLEKTVRRAGLDCVRFATRSSSDNRDDAPECLLATYGSGERAFYFHGHYDVVPAQSREQFQPLRKDHFLFGRGSCA